MNSLAKTKKGQAGGGVGFLGVTLVVVAVTLIIGVVVFQQVYNSVPALTGTANTTVTGIQTTVYNAFSLGSVSLIVLAAVAILAVLFLLSGRR